MVAEDADVFHVGFSAECFESVDVRAYYECELW